jgi:hypothetical protein
VNVAGLPALPRRSVIHTSSIVFRVALALALAGCGGSKPMTRTTSHSFDTRYDRRQAESYVDETVLAKEEASNEPSTSREAELESKVLLKSTKCTLVEPPPFATRMVCRVLVSVEELHPASKTTHVNRWTVHVSIDPTTSALTIKATKENAVL